jgi:hypothetical protein
MQNETAKKYVVEVYSDKGPLEASPWAKIGEFSRPSEAVDACKQAVDRALDKKGEFELDAQSLVHYYLNFGGEPFINGVENIATFDLQAYLANRCGELAAGNR